MARWLARCFYFLIQMMVWFHLCVLLSFRSRGRERVPRHGPVLIVSNHESFLDPPAVACATWRPLNFLARKTLFHHPFFGGLISALNAVPIDQDGVGKDGIRAILDRLEQGGAVLIFPEGERCLDGELHDLKPGIGLLLRRVRVPILPVGVAGAFESWPRNQKLPKLAPLFLPPNECCLAVAFGQVRDPATLDGLSREEMLKVIKNDIAQAMVIAESIRRK